jgi:hypothetical protein
MNSYVEICCVWLGLSIGWRLDLRSILLPHGFIQVQYVERQAYHFFLSPLPLRPIPVAARSNAGVCGRSLAGIAGLYPEGDTDVLSIESVMYSQVEFSASGWLLAQRSRTGYGASACDREASIMRRPCPTRACRVMEKNMYLTVQT